MFSKSFFALALLAASAAAQSETTTSTTDTTSSAVDPSGSAPGGISACIIGCVQPAAQQNGCAFTDAPCVCASAQFQADAAACLQRECTEADQQAALALQAQQCGAIGVSATGSATPHPVSSSTGSGTRTTAAPSTTPTRPTTSGTSGTGSGTAPPPANTSNAAMVLGENWGLAGAIVAGVVGLVL